MRVTPVDYKKGKRPHTPQGAWEPERVQVCTQGLILRDNGFETAEGVIYFAGSKERVAVEFDKALVARTLELAGQMAEVSRGSLIPPPLEDSPKCPRCSLVGICLPDEVRLLKAAGGQMAPDAPGHELVDRAIRRSENTLDLIDDLLRYSRIQSAAILDRFAPVELAEIVRSAAELFRAQADEKHVQLDVLAESAVISGIRDSLADAVNNLLSNAIRYTPSGGRVSVECGCRDGSAMLIVSDTGIGIPQDELPRLFEEFFRGEAARKTALHGTGLGMAIAKRVVDRHGGHIGVESQVGRGTTFRVALPPCLATG
jgi:signal transduction histidine kinase